MLPFFSSKKQCCVSSFLAFLFTWDYSLTLVNLGEDASKPLKSLLAPKSQPFFFAFLFTWDYSLRS
jgi:hypothetical protein